MTLSVEESIELALKHFLSAGVEHSIHLPDIGWENLHKQLLKKQIENLVQGFNLDKGLPPDLIILLMKDPKATSVLINKYCGLAKI